MKYSRVLFFLALVLASLGISCASYVQSTTFPTQEPPPESVTPSSTLIINSTATITKTSMTTNFSVASIILTNATTRTIATTVAITKTSPFLPDALLILGIGAIAIAALLVAIVSYLKRPPPILPPPEHVRGVQVQWLQYRVGLVSDPGKVRTNNEDSTLAIETISTFESAKQTRVLCAVADGVGGSQKGEVASRLALETVASQIPQNILSSDGSKIEESLKHSIAEANRVVLEYATAHPESEGMATTIVAGIISEKKAFIAHAGDSRAYLINRAEIKRLTKDHSQVQELVDAGRITPEQALDYPGRNVITRAVGANSDIQVDTTSLEIAPGDMILLCSDGLWDLMLDQEIQQTVFQVEGPQMACEKLASLANERGGKDNISIVIVKCEGPVETEPEPMQR